jgi:hypothetical protein
MPHGFVRCSQRRFFTLSWAKEKRVEKINKRKQIFFMAIIVYAENIWLLLIEYTMPLVADNSQLQVFF